MDAVTAAVDEARSAAERSIVGPGHAHRSRTDARLAGQARPPRGRRARQPRSASARPSRSPGSRAFATGPDRPWTSRRVGRPRTSWATCSADWTPRESAPSRRGRRGHAPGAPPPRSRASRPWRTWRRPSTISSANQRARRVLAPTRAGRRTDRDAPRRGGGDPRGPARGRGLSRAHRRRQRRWLRPVPRGAPGAGAGSHHHPRAQRGRQDHLPGLHPRHALRLRARPLPGPQRRSTRRLAQRGDGRRSTLPHRALRRQGRRRQAVRPG